MNIYPLELSCATAFIYVLDVISHYLHPILCKSHLVDNKISESERWFFIHIINNIIVMYAAYYELMDCVDHIYICDKKPMNSLSTYAVIVAKASHLYHLLFFKHMSYETLLHHIIMGVFCGPVVYFLNNTQLMIANLFFLSGLPGFLDYTNLYLVKLGYLSSKKQKLIYFYISMFIRSPGILFLSIIQLLFNNGVTFSEYMIRYLLAFITIWNSQYFLYLTIKDCIRKNVLV